MRDDSPAARNLFLSHVSSGEERRCPPDQAASLHAGYDSDSGDPRGSNFWCRRSASVRVATTALKSATILAMTPLGLGLFLGLALRAGFFVAASLDLFSPRSCALSCAFSWCPRRVFSLPLKRTFCALS